MSEQKTEWKILCSTHMACPAVMAELEKMGFQKVKDTPNSPTSDISAILMIDNEQKLSKTSKTLLEKFRKDIQQITITSY